MSTGTGTSMATIPPPLDLSLLDNSVREEDNEQACASAAQASPSPLVTVQCSSPILGIQPPAPSPDDSMSDSDEDIETVMFLLTLPKQKCIWKKPASSDWYERVLPTLSDEDFKENFRMSRAGVQVLIDRVGPSIRKKDTKFRKAITVEKRVLIALYYLGSSCEHRVTKSLFGVGKTTCHTIVNEFVHAVITNLEKELVVFPNTKEKLKSHADQFGLLHGLPQCVGSMDGSHIPFCAPTSDATDYHCYKGFQSMLLFGVVDASYKFTFLNVGAPGRSNDAEILCVSTPLWNLIQSDLLDSLSKKICGVDVPAYFIGDSAFPLHRHLMKPYPQHRGLDQVQANFNRILSGARIVVENSFGRLKGRFRKLRRLEGKVKNAQKIVVCCCILHNLCETMSDSPGRDWQIEDTASQGNVPQVPVGRATDSAKALRDSLAHAAFNRFQ